MAEWSMAVVLKTTVPETAPGVRIPLPPPPFARVIVRELWVARQEDFTIGEVGRSDRLLQLAEEPSGFPRKVPSTPGVDAPPDAKRHHLAAASTRSTTLWSVQ